MARQPGGDYAAPLSRPAPSMESLSNPNTPIARCRSAGEVAAAEMALIRSNTVAIGRGGGRSRFCPTGRTGGDSTEANSSGPRYTAAHLRCRGGTGRGADHQIGGLCHIETSFGQACDDTDLPRISGSPTTTEDQSNVVDHLPTISARGHSCPSKYQDRALWPVRGYGSQVHPPLSSHARCGRR